MNTVQHTTPASAEEVWAVLADGWSFSSWVAGASRVRAVEPDWPAPGSHIHHSVGTWPLVLDDHTEVAEAQDHELLVSPPTPDPWAGRGSGSS